MSEPQDTPVPFSVRPTLYTWLLLMLAVLIPLVLLVRPYLVSIASGCVLAVLMYPVYVRLRRYLPKWAAGLLVSTGVVLLVLIPATAITIGAIRQGAAVIAQITANGAPTVVGFVETLRRWAPFLDTIASPQEVQGSLQEGLRAVATWEVASRCVSSRPSPSSSSTWR